LRASSALLIRRSSLSLRTLFFFVGSAIDILNSKAEKYHKMALIRTEKS
jgi:hypothetical protein